MPEESYCYESSATSDQILGLLLAWLPKSRQRKMKLAISQLQKKITFKKMKSFLPIVISCPPFLQFFSSKATRFFVIDIHEDARPRYIWMINLVDLNVPQ